MLSKTSRNDMQWHAARTPDTSFSSHHHKKEHAFSSSLDTYFSIPLLAPDYLSSWVKFEDVHEPNEFPPRKKLAVELDCRIGGTFVEKQGNRRYLSAGSGVCPRNVPDFLPTSLGRNEWSSAGTTSLARERRFSMANAYTEQHPLV